MTYHMAPEIRQGVPKILLITYAKPLNAIMKGGDRFHITDEGESLQHGKIWFGGISTTYYL